LKVLSLFSGCGGMDLGLEGGFLAHRSSINSDLYASYISDHDENYVYLKKQDLKLFLLMIFCLLQNWLGVIFSKIE
jgi:site-specific DNA-cytosine methylase